MLYIVDRFACSDTFVVVFEEEVIAAPVKRCKLARILPSERIAGTVVIGQGVADLVVSEAHASVRGQLIAPSRITVHIIVRAVQCGGRRSRSGQGIRGFGQDITCGIIGIDVGSAETWVIPKGN